MTVDDLVNNPAYVGKTVRITGAVIGDSIDYDTNTLLIQFTVANVANDAADLGQALHDAVGRYQRDPAAGARREHGQAGTAAKRGAGDHDRHARQRWRVPRHRTAAEMPVALRRKRSGAGTARPRSANNRFKSVQAHKRCWLKSVLPGWRWRSAPRSTRLSRRCYGARRHSDRLVVSARNAALLTFPLLLLAAFSLLSALLTQQYQIGYVWQVTDPNTPTFFRFTALVGIAAGVAAVLVPADEPVRLRGDSDQLAQQPRR